MRDRTIICEFYICHGQCEKGLDADFATVCQHCGKYRKKAGAVPSRVDNRRRKMDKILKKEARY